ncbi:MAG: L,D-transpeptidase [Actinobacteria bacterium]|nr:L,D-transpeptidase [Actinomycetota bacterium]
MNNKKFHLLVIITAAVCLCGLLFAAGNVSADGSGSPYGLTVTLPESSIGGVLKLTWEVDNPAEIASCRIFRSTDRLTGYELVFENEVDMPSGRRMDFVDTSLKEGGTYYYKISATGKDGVTRFSNVAGGFVPERQAGEVKSSDYVGKRIVISVVDQRIYFLENEVLIKSHLCSTGTYSHPTPEGLFKVLYHDRCVISEKYGGAYCYWWLGFFTDTGMHALPYNPSTGTWTGASLLGQRASHGCVRQALADAEWAYNWAPDGTRLEVVNLHFDPPAPPPPPPPPITGGHASLGADEASQVWYLAEGCTTGTLNEYVLMMNPNPDTVNVTAEYMKPDGSVITQNYAVAPFSRYTVHVDDIGGLEETEVSTRLNSDKPIAAERSMYFDYNGKDGGSNSSGVTKTSNTWYLAEGYTGGDFDEFILIQNPGNEDATANVQYMRPDGFNYNQTVPVGAHSRVSLHVDDIPELAATEVSAMITSNQPVVVERAQYFDYYGKKDGNASAGITDTSKEWYLAEGYTGGSFDTYVLIQNPGELPANVTATFMKSDGENIVKEYAVGPGSRYSIHLDEIPGLENAEVSTFLESDADVISERAMYFESYGRYGGADAPGIPESAKYWYLPEGYTGGDFDTYVLVMNPNNETTIIDVNFLQPNGTITAKKYEIGPNSRYTIHVDSIDGLTNAEFSTALTGSNPVICERAMYFSIPRDQL